METQKAFQVYLLHFDKPYKKARHYIGIAKSSRLHRRMYEHATLRGSNLTVAALEDGAELLLVRTWQTDDPNVERKFKANGHFNRLCPLCSIPPWQDFEPILRITHKKRGTEPAEAGTVPPVLDWGTFECTAEKTP